MIDSDTARFSVEPFGLNDWAAVRPVMLKAYPHSAAAWWDAGVARVRQAPPNPEQAPLGVVLRRAGEPVGAALMYHSRRPQEPARWRVSASSWAILDPWRSRALSMARQAMADDSQVYTALTPIAAATRMLQRLGFQAVSHQALLHLTPLWRRQPHTGAAVRQGEDALQALRDDPLAEALHDHHRLGLRVMALEQPNGWEPLVWRRSVRLRHVPVAELIYTRSQVLALRHAGDLSRALWRQGVPLMAIEGHEDLVVEHGCTRLFQRRFARGDYPRAGIDHLYSELVYLHR